MAKFKLFSRSKKQSPIQIEKDIDPVLGAAPLDDFAYDEPFDDGDSLKNHIWVLIAINTINRCIQRADYELQIDGVHVPTKFDAIFDNSGGNSPANTLFFQSSLWWGWEREFFWWWGNDMGFRGVESVTCLDPREVFHRIDGEGKVHFYWYDILNAKYYEMKEGEFLHIFEPNVYNKYRGVFPLAIAGTYLLKQDRLINLGNLDALQNGPIPDIILSAKRNISPKQSKEAIDTWNDKYVRSKGGSRVAVIGGDVTPHIMKNDLIKYLDVSDWNRGTILAAYGVPLKVANAESERTALSGKDSNEQYAALFSQTIIPTIDLWAGEINRQLFAATGNPEISGVFKLDKVPELQEDENRVSKRENDAIAAGKKTINQIRAIHGEAPVPWGDTWWRDAKLVDATKPIPEGKE